MDARKVTEGQDVIVFVVSASSPSFRNVTPV